MSKYEKDYYQAPESLRDLIKQAAHLGTEHPKPQEVPRLHLAALADTQEHEGGPMKLWHRIDKQDGTEALMLEGEVKEKLKGFYVDIPLAIAAAKKDGTRLATNFAHYEYRAAERVERPCT